MKAITFWKQINELDGMEHPIVVKYYVAPAEPDVGLFSPYIEFDEFIWAEDPDTMPSEPETYLTAADRWLIESDCWENEKEEYTL